MLPSISQPMASFEGRIGRSATLSSLDLLILLMASWYLLIDASNGVLLQFFGVSAPISAAYKSGLLLLIGFALIQQRINGLLLILIVFLLFCLGPTYSLILFGHQSGFTYDLGMFLKLLSPWLAALYFYNFTQRHPAEAAIALHRVFLFSFIILVLNLVLGRLGFGFTAYLPNDYLPDLNLGTKGFFKATNELSALLLLLSAWLMAKYWLSSKFKFSLVLMASLFAANSMLTKTSLGGVLLITALIPFLLLISVWRRYWKFLLTALLLLGVLFVLILWHLPWLLQTLGVGAKLQLIYQQQGFIGVLLSSRDLYALANWQLSEQYFSHWHRLFGVGVAGLDLYSGKTLAEIDPVDLTIWYGFIGFSYFVLWFVFILWISVRSYLRFPASGAAGLFVANLMLLCVSIFAGHTLTSGMLWIPWGMLNGYYAYFLLRAERPNGAQ